MTSQRIKSLLGYGVAGPSSTSPGLPAANAKPNHPPRTSETRHFGGALGIRSPGLRPTPETDVLEHNDLADDIDFLSLDGAKYDEPEYFAADDAENANEQANGLEGEDTNDDDLADWPEHDGTGNDTAVHIEGVPRSDLRLEVRLYKTQPFAESVMALLRNQIKVPGWAELPPELTEVSQMNVHKVSGSLTNAVFFISYPVTEPLNEEDDNICPPTVLLRIYGPSTGNLISRRKELHVLNTLSAVYDIGPAILGTFANGRIEEYFESRALRVEEMRQPRISRWIARRMRELHSVDINVMELPPEDPAQKERRDSLQLQGLSRRSTEYAESSSYFASPVLRPRFSGSPSPISRPEMPNKDSAASGNSLLSTSAASIRSFSSLSSGSEGARSPFLRARTSSRPGVSESPAPRKKRSNSSLGSRPTFSLEGEKASKPKSVVWENIDSWTQEARKVLSKVKKLESVLQERGLDNESLIEDVNPLVAPSLLRKCKKVLDIKKFESEVKRYRKHIHEWEANHGKSKRVFAHNDTQCGNLLILTPDGKDEMVPGLRAPHEMIIVVDFEYAGVNPRGFDIANHFLEWTADYHHPTLSHSVTKHGLYPTLEQRQRFYRAYVPCDAGFDMGKEQVIPALAQDDQRVQRLEEEVRLWTGASHAMYTVWAIVQATDDIVRHINEWIQDPAAAEKAESFAEQLRSSLSKRSKDGTPAGRPALVRGRSGEEIDTRKSSVAQEMTGDSDPIQPPQIGDFDYLSYAMERVQLFRDELQKLDVK